ncbi:MAG TPA: DUF1116 domain-containing protein [Candidatus Avidesulfovibrio excrementigallinarum]|nr:DUF1116 domain-containing protein [Candidatus Avidesulfovibrio excrementigallinarum]
MGIRSANEEAIRRIRKGTAHLVGMKVARDVVPGLTGKTLLHSGPPIEWKDMCGTQRGAMIGSILFEGWAKTPEEAIELADSGAISLDCCHHRRSIGPMAGIISPSMAVYVTRNEAFDHEIYTTLNMGLGRVLRMGAYDPEIIDKLRWMNDGMAETLAVALERSGGLDIKQLMAQALQMGDELHNRNKAASALFIRYLGGAIASVGGPDAARTLEHLGSSDGMFLNNAMAACKAMVDPAHGIEDCTIVTALSRNGVEFGIRVSGLGDQWFTAPSPYVKGVFFPGYSAADADRDIGDSAITETMGFGAFSMAAAPAITQLVGGTAASAMDITRRMYEITVSESDVFRIPALEFRGIPQGIDIRKVIETGMEPEIDTGISHKAGGIGQIGAGLTVAPMECFVKALKAFAAKRNLA